MNRWIFMKILSMNMCTWSTMTLVTPSMLFRRRCIEVVDCNDISEVFRWNCRRVSLGIHYPPLILIILSFIHPYCGLQRCNSKISVRYPSRVLEYNFRNSIFVICELWYLHNYLTQTVFSLVSWRFDNCPP